MGDDKTSFGPFMLSPGPVVSVSGPVWFWILCIIGMTAALIMGICVDVKTSRLDAGCQAACGPQAVEVRIDTVCWCRTADPNMLRRTRVVESTPTAPTPPETP